MLCVGCIIFRSQTIHDRRTYTYGIEGVTEVQKLRRAMSDGLSRCPTPEPAQSPRDGLAAQVKQLQEHVERLEEDNRRLRLLRQANLSEIYEQGQAAPAGGATGVEDEGKHDMVASYLAAETKRMRRELADKNALIARLSRLADVLPEDEMLKGVLAEDMETQHRRERARWRWQQAMLRVGLAHRQKRVERASAKQLVVHWLGAQHQKGAIERINTQLQETKLMLDRTLAEREFLEAQAKEIGEEKASLQAQQTALIRTALEAAQRDKQLLQVADSAEERAIAASKRKDELASEIHHLRWLVKQVEEAAAASMDRSALLESERDFARKEILDARRRQAAAEQRVALHLQQKHEAEAELVATRAEMGAQMDELRRKEVRGARGSTAELAHQLEALRHARHCDAEAFDRMRTTARLLAARVVELEGSFGEILRPSAPNAAIARAIESLSDGDGTSITFTMPSAAEGATMALGAFPIGRRISATPPRRASDYRPSIMPTPTCEPPRGALSTPPALAPAACGPIRAVDMASSRAKATSYAHAFTSSRAQMQMACSPLAGPPLKSSSLAASLSMPSIVLSPSLLPLPRPITSPLISPMQRAPADLNVASLPVARGAARAASRQGTPLNCASRNETWHVVRCHANASVTGAAAESNPVGPWRPEWSLS